MRMTISLLSVLLSICLASLAGAQAGVTLLVKTDTNCNWKLDGQPMGLLEADASKVVLVSPGAHLIEAFTPIGGGTVMTKVEVDKVEKTVYILLKGQNDQLSKLQQAETPKEAVVADAAQNQTWTDPATGLMWTRQDNGADVDWDQADDYCSKLELAGYKVWRLPTLEELQGIYDPSVSVRRLFGSGYTVDVHVKGNLKLTGSTWSSRQGDHPGKGYQNAWFFELGGPPNSSNIGKPLSNFLHFSWNMRALCVGRSGE